MNKKTSLFVDEDLWWKFGLRCHNNRTTKTKALNDLLEKYLKEPGA